MQVQGGTAPARVEADGDHRGRGLLGGESHELGRSGANGKRVEKFFWDSNSTPTTYTKDRNMSTLSDIFLTLAFSALIMVLFQLFELALISDHDHPPLSC